jgi:hypothetical protein
MPRGFRFDFHPITPNEAHRQSFLQTPSQSPPPTALLSMVLRELATRVNRPARTGSLLPRRELRLIAATKPDRLGRQFVAENRKSG